MLLPLGLAYNDRDEVVLDPDRAVVEAISLVFATFRRTGSAMQTLKWFRKNAVHTCTRRTNAAASALRIRRVGDQSMHDPIENRAYDQDVRT